MKSMIPAIVFLLTGITLATGQERSWSFSSDAVFDSGRDSVLLVNESETDTLRFDSVAIETVMPANRVTVGFVTPAPTPPFYRRGYEVWHQNGQTQVQGGQLNS